MITGWYVLEEDGRTPRHLGFGVDAARQWEEQRAEGRFQTFETYTEEWRISTVFLGLDHGFGRGTPLLWETMVFPKDRESLGGLMQDERWSPCERYSSWEEARAGHDAVVREALRHKLKSEVG